MKRSSVLLSFQKLVGIFQCHIALKKSLGRLLQKKKMKHGTISKEIEGEGGQHWVIVRVAYWQLSPVAYNILIVEIRANIYFRAVSGTPLRLVSPATPKARRTAYLPMRTSEKYDSWMHSSRCVHTVHSRAVTAQPLFMFLSAQLRTRSAKQIKMFSRVPDSFSAFSRS